MDTSLRGLLLAGVAMVPAKFTTTSLPPRDQFAAWRDWYASVFETDLPDPARQGFAATNSTWRLGTLAVSQGSAPSIRTWRTKTLLRRSPIDHWVVTVYTRGTVEVDTGGVSLSPRVGVPFTISLADEMATDKTDYDRIQLYLARDAFRGIAALLDAARATAMDTPEGHLLADYMILLARNLPDLAMEDGPRLVDAVEAMLGACLAPSASRIAEVGKQMDLTLMERVRRAVRTHLRSPLLGPDKLCREAATSRSQLYRLLEGEGGVAHYIQSRRLSESFTLLCDASNALPIASIAETLCFADASSFSRAFRREFGLSPSDVRAASLTGLPAVGPPSDSSDNPIRRFSDCLSGF
jgi:AraC-like DNA-binding protein